MGRMGVVATVLLASTSACTGEPPTPERSFDQAFREVGRIQLEESPGDPMVAITSLEPLDDGGFAIADGPASRIRIFNANGSIRATFGREGDGPGELRQPTGVGVDEAGNLFVVERDSPRLSVFDANGFVDSWSVPGAYGSQVEVVDDALLLGVGTRAERFALVSRSGELHTLFAARSAVVASTPYWVFLVQDRAVRLGDQILVNTSFFPTIRAFTSDGEETGSFDVTSSGWSPPTAPEESWFEDPRNDASIAAWMTSFSMITGLATVGDSILVVQGGGYDPQPNDIAREHNEEVAVFSALGTKLAENLVLTQPILAGGDRLYVLVDQPPAPWTVGVFEWIGGRGAN